MESFIQFAKENFLHIMPIVIVAIFGLLVALDRIYSLFFIYPMKNPSGFLEMIRALVMSDRINEAILLCERNRPKPVAAVVKEGLVRCHQPESLIENGLQLSVSEAVQKTQVRTAFLSTSANVATLLGLLGTILGLIQSFNAVSVANAQEKSALLAAGISTAMNATMLGLGVAVPCMIIYSFLMSQTNRLNAEIDQSAVRILDVLKQRYYQAGSNIDENTNTGRSPQPPASSTSSSPSKNPQGPKKGI